MKQPIRILFLCTGNSCRSQMAEGWARTLVPETLEAYSAGVERHGKNPRAVEAMREAGVDISGQSSKTVDDLPPDLALDFVITLCGHANENCPFFPGPVKKLHHGFDDPPQLASKAADEEQAMAPYRRVRDEIRDWIKQLPAELGVG